MIAAWYEQQGPAREVLVVGQMEEPRPAPGEVRIRISVSGVNQGDVKKRRDAFGYGMPFPRVVPHSDGAGVVDWVGRGVAPTWVGQRVWCYGAQSYRPFGTAAEYTTVPAHQAVPLPDSVSFECGASIGIPGITAHRAVHVAGPLTGRTVLVQGGGGAVGACAIHFAHRAGARVIATARNPAAQALADLSGADVVVEPGPDLAERVREFAPDGVDHIVEVDLASNLAVDSSLLSQGGSIAAYASSSPLPALPFWPLVFGNARLHFLGSDDFTIADKVAAAECVRRALEMGWEGLPVGLRVPLAEIAAAHEWQEQPGNFGRAVVCVG